jgi:His/Glu/Gln/Arg/opine family amino acid ABC transporter permease subunit
MENVFKLVSRYGYVFMDGLWGTLWLSGVTVFFGTVLGTVVALAEMRGGRAVHAILKGYVQVLRGTPILLQLYFFWPLLPKVIPFQLSDTACVVTALIVNSSSYVAEIIRAGVQAVDGGQREAARSLGLTDGQAMRYVILPQAVKNILPALGNQFIIMVKETSLASVFFVGELMTSYKIVQSTTFLPIPSLVIVAVIYFVMTTVMTRGVQVYERKLQSAD